MKGNPARALLLTLSIAANLPAMAATIFDNSVNDLHARFEPGPLEVGDEILLAGTERYLTNFAFEFWGTNLDGTADFAGAVEGRVRFYLNDGPPFNGYGTPGTVLFDSDWFLLPGPTPRSTLVFSAGADFPAGGLLLPASNLTWSVQFRGQAAADSVGVDIYSPPVTGSDWPDYWELGEGWQLKTNWVPVDFAARFEATAAPVQAAPTLELVRAGHQAVLSWPASATNFILETSGSLGPRALWLPLTKRITLSGDRFVRTNEMWAPAAFYRLRRP